MRHCAHFRPDVIHKLREMILIALRGTGWAKRQSDVAKSTERAESLARMVEENVSRARRFGLVLDEAHRIEGHMLNRRK